VDAQDGIRAQLAECLIAVVCQRLDYLDKQQLQVPAVRS
jgi:Tfp pilus assembly pilus retraction ATPase PilT